MQDKPEKPMTFSQFIRYVPRMERVHPEWRKGQAAFNTLWDWRRDLAVVLVDSTVDPYHHDSRLPEFYAWVGEHW